MTKTFTLQFTFEQKEYDAVVTVVEDPDPSSLTVSITADRLQQLVPEGKEALQIELDENRNSQATTPVERLKQAILQAYKKHEEQSPPVNLW